MMDIYIIKYKKNIILFYFLCVIIKFIYFKNVDIIILF